LLLVGTHCRSFQRRYVAWQTKVESRTTAERYHVTVVELVVLLHNRSYS